MDSMFGQMPSSRIALEVGTHSPWVSRQLAAMGHEVIVANAHKVKLITQSTRKNDRVDAQKLAMLARVDVRLLSPIRHRGAEAQADLTVIRARAELVEARTKLVSSARGLVKPMGERLGKCDADVVSETLAHGLTEAVRQVVGPLLRSVEGLTEQIGVYDEKIEAIAKRYPEVELLQAVWGVGILTSLTFILTLDNPQRLKHSRDAGAVVGLQPKQRESGDSKPELGISKCGDRLLRVYLVQSAQCILRRGAPESDLRTWGLGKAKGGKKAKKRAVVGVARKLAVLLHHLWATGEEYDPLYNRKAKAAAKKAKAAA
jgi:transposase